MKRIDCVITQNIDGLHQRAGSKRVIEIHGSIGRISCTQCAAAYATDEVLDHVILQDVPICERCGGSLKPNVILFGEAIPKKTLNEAIKKVKSTDLLLTVGTSLEVYPAASFPEDAKKSGARIVSINTERTVWDDLCDYKMHGHAAEILPRIVQAMKISF